jgi:hypothetical protein
MAEVICRVLLTDWIRSRMSRRLATVLLPVGWDVLLREA